MVIVICIMFMVRLYITNVSCSHKFEFRRKLPSLIAAIGTVSYCFFLSVVASVQGGGFPLHYASQWLLHALVLSQPEQGARHDTMVVLSALARLLPLGSTSSALWVMYVFPSRMRNADAFHFNCWGFLFSRFKPHAYWYGLVIILRRDSWLLDQCSLSSPCKYTSACWS